MGEIIVKILWQPSTLRSTSSSMHRFMRFKNFSSYTDLHHYSLQTHLKESFWKDLLDFYPVIYEGNPSDGLGQKSFMEYNWFPSLKLNFAENLLLNGKNEQIAIMYEHESGISRDISYRDLKSAVKGFQTCVQDVIGPGDVVAAYMPNVPETVIAMLGTSSLGGIFTSISCDFGPQGVLSRLAQTEPKVLVTATAYEYNGKRYDLKSSIQKIISELKSLKKVIVVNVLKTGDQIAGTNTWEDVVHPQSGDLEFIRMPFKSPLYIMYSSGTTGRPKCIVHCVGGVLLQHIKELGLHCDFSQEKTIFYFTTCAWMMWNWLVSGLFFGGTICLFEGSPKFPSLKHFFNIINRKNIHIFGTSPQFLQALKGSGYDKDMELSTLETILSTGSPLSEELFEFVYGRIKSDVMLSSIAGGTDILGCFVLGNPLLPVYSGEISCVGLGMDVDVFDERGQSVPASTQGELVCKSSFPSQPVLGLFKNDQANYQKTYFSKYDNIWHHGDRIRLSKVGSVRMFGRSDATLNPGGIRIGTSEIYDAIEQIKGIEDGLCIDKTFGNDTKILLFVKCQKGVVLDEKLKDQIVSHIKKKLTVRHLPYRIFQVDGIPYTKNGKKMEVLIRRLIEGQHDLENKSDSCYQEEAYLEALANPQCLEQYKKLFSK